MKSIENFCSKLENGKLCLGSAVTLSDPLISDVLGDYVDFLWYDLEHSPISIDSLKTHLIAARLHNVPSIVRVPTGETAFIKQMLDSGADGILVPQIRTVQEVKNVISDCRYPPVGCRGFGPRIPSRYGKIETEEFIEQANKDVFVSIMIETTEALECIEDIVNIPGLDSVVIGPSDLSISLGIPGQLKHKKEVEAIKKVVRTAKAAKTFVGAGLGPESDYAIFLANIGIQWLQVGGDFGYMAKHVNQLFNDIEKSIEV